MAKFYTELTSELTSFIQEQKIFFTATAPIDGRINLSPKGIDTFRVINHRQVGYLDLTGSGNETAAHLKENGRMTIMFCSFTEQPLILRLYGHGEVISIHDQAWETISNLFTLLPGTRQIIRLNIDSLQTSCGFGVPMYDNAQERSILLDWAEKKGESGIRNYWQEKNQISIDGLPTGIIDS